MLPNILTAEIHNVHCYPNALERVRLEVASSKICKDFGFALPREPIRGALMVYLGLLLLKQSQDENKKKEMKKKCIDLFQQVSRGGADSKGKSLNCAYVGGGPGFENHLPLMRNAMSIFLPDTKAKTSICLLLFALGCTWTMTTPYPSDDSWVKDYWFEVD